MKYVFEYGFLVCIFALCSAGIFLHTMPQASLMVASFASSVLPLPATSTPVLFVGDVMLARNVEFLMEEHGIAHPFSKVDSFLQQYPFVVGNFEATIPPVHKRTPSMTFRFSVKESYASVLKEKGFTHFSLANNHAYDFGASGYMHTREVLARNGLIAFGNPRALSVEDVTTLDLGSYSLALVPIHGVSGLPKEEEVKRVLALVNADVVLVYIHWGEEYVSVPEERYRTYAHMLVESGVDAVIGHHPHVVQSVELYNNAPIFYSLGNFIFDQYWNTDVQTGLGVSIVRDGDMLRYELHPFMSDRSVPRTMTREERDAFVAHIRSISDASATDMLQKLVIEVPFPLLATTKY